MTITEQIITISVVVLGTVATRALMFILFPKGKAVPKFVKYLGQVLPMAVIGMLVVYCLKDVSLVGGSYGLPEAIAILVVVGLHMWKKKMLLSIAGGTVVYMFLVQSVFK